MLSLVGGAVLTRYLLPMFPCFYMALVLMVEALPRPVMRAAFVIVAAAFVGSWFINPSYPFAYENNLSYVDFIRLHQQAAEWLGQLTLAVRAATPVDVLLDTIQPYPTFSEGVFFAVRELADALA